MALVTAYTGAVAAHSTVNVPAQALTAPFRGVELVMSQIMASVVPFGCRVAYAVSLDGGVSYSDYLPVGHEPNSEVPTGTASINKTSILINEFATHVKFQIANASQSVACTTFVLQMFSFT